jgi:hypothetical protein
MQSVSNQESQDVYKWEEIEDEDLTDFSTEIENGLITDFSAENEDGELTDFSAESKDEELTDFSTAETEDEELTDSSTQPDETVRVVEYTHMECIHTQIHQKETIDHFVGENKSKKKFDYFVIIDFEGTCGFLKNPRYIK